VITQIASASEQDNGRKLMRRGEPPTEKWRKRDFSGLSGPKRNEQLSIAGEKRAFPLYLLTLISPLSIASDLYILLYLLSTH
jgi:hypothetical protein